MNELCGCIIPFFPVTLTDLAFFEFFSCTPDWQQLHHVEQPVFFKRQQIIIRLHVEPGAWGDISLLPAKVEIDIVEQIYNIIDHRGFAGPVFAGHHVDVIQVRLSISVGPEVLRQGLVPQALTQDALMAVIGEDAGGGQIQVDLFQPPKLFLVPVRIQKFHMTVQQFHLPPPVLR